MMKFLSAMTGLVGTTMVSSQAFARELPVPDQSWERLWDTVILDITVIGVIMTVMAVWFLWRYRATSPDQVGTAKKLTTVQSIAFALIPASIFMADDFYLAANGWTVWNDYRRVPDNAMEVKVTGYQWYFEYEYPGGVLVEADMDTPIMIPVGQPVVFRMTSEDVIHSFGIPKYRVKEDVMPGRQTYVWVNPVDAQTNGVVQCAEFCGEAHSQMANPIHAVPQAQYNAWIAKMAAEG